MEENDHLIESLIECGHLTLGKCSKCRRNRTLTKYYRHKEGFAARGPKCRKYVPITKSSFFTDSRLTIKHILQILYCWSQDLNQQQTVKMTGLSRCSVNQYLRYCRDVCSKKLINDDEKFMFGGDGVVVQIDESVVTRRKYNRGKQVEMKWILDIYDTKEKRGLITYVIKNATTLAAIIKSHVKVGSEIWTDEWKGYNGLQNLGYMHKTVNHSKFFKDQITGVCTNHVEGLWATMKKALRRKNVMCSVLLGEHIHEFMWRQTYVEKTKTNAMEILMRHIGEQYKL